MSSTTPATSVTELAGEGTDTVQSSVTYTLGANVENLTLTGAAAINGTGNALANIITGNARQQHRSTAAAAPTRMTGGAGNDTYVVDNAGDVGRPRARARAPTRCRASVSYTLGGQRREPDADRRGQHQRHRQRARQHHHRQQRQQRLDGGAGADT